MPLGEELPITADPVRSASDGAATGAVAAKMQVKKSSRPDADNQD